MFEAAVIAVSPVSVSFNVCSETPGSGVVHSCAGLVSYPMVRKRENTRLAHCLLKIIFVFWVASSPATTASYVFTKIVILVTLGSKSSAGETVLGYNKKKQ